MTTIVISIISITKTINYFKRMFVLKDNIKILTNQNKKEYLLLDVLSISRYSYIVN